MKILNSLVLYIPNPLLWKIFGESLSIVYKIIRFTHIIICNFQFLFWKKINIVLNFKLVNVIIVPF